MLAWSNFMRAHGITHVLSLLAPDELAAYTEPVGPAMEAAGFVYRNVWMKRPGAAREALSALDAAAKSGGRAVVHCWGGGGRAGRMCAAWVAHRHGLSPEAAASRVRDAAAAAGAGRRADADSLEQFLRG